MRSSRALLVAVGGGLGDTLLAGVVARALRNRFATVDALVLPAHVPIADHDPVYGTIRSFTGVRAAVAEIRPERYDAAVVTWATLRTALVPALAGVPVRVGQARRPYSALFTHRVVVRSERGDRTTHWTQILLDYARAIGCDDPAAQPVFVPSDEDRAAADALRAARGVGEAYAILHPTRGIARVAQRWPAEGLRRLAQTLTARDGLPLLVTGSAADAPVTEAIAAGTGALDVAGATTLGAFAALAAGARYVVAMDSGPMHVAAATGAPTVGLFPLRSDEPARWAPRGPRVEVVRGAYPCPAHHRKETCPDFPCVRELDTTAVVAALARLGR